MLATPRCSVSGLVAAMLVVASFSCYNPNFAQSGAGKAQSAKQPPRKQSEKQAAIVAVGIGKAIYEWLTYCLDAKPSRAAQLAVESNETVLDVGAGVLGLSLSPSPHQARMGLPKDSVAKVTAAYAIAKKWDAQVAQATRSNEYLFGHFVVGRTIGAICQMIDGDLLPNDGGSPLEVLKQLPDAWNTTDYFDYLPISLRSKFTTLIRDFEARPRTRPNWMWLGSALDSWLDEFLEAAQKST